jgi:hypothetical protein
MEISKEDFLLQGARLNIPAAQMDALWDALAKSESTSPSGGLSKVIFYLGALIVISAMTWFLGLGWEWFGGGGIFLIASLYAISLATLGAFLWHKDDLKVPAGLLITIAVCLVPLAIYGLEEYWGIWPENNPGEYVDFYSRIKGSWIFMEIGTILAGLLALYFFPFAFLLVPLFVAGWFLILDFIALVTNKEFPWELTNSVAMCYGGLLMVLGYLLDKAKKENFAFWSWLFGTFAFWGSFLNLVWDKHEIFLILFLLVNLVMIVGSIVLQRKVLLVFGGIGVFSYLAHLAYDLFQNSIWFPFILSFIGLAVIYLGVLYQRNRSLIEKKVTEFMSHFSKN